MTSRLILHLGLNKTGTTSIQRSFQSLDEPGLRYLDAGAPNHSRLMINYGRHLSGQPLEPLAERDVPLAPEVGLQTLLDALDDPKPGTLVISAEFLSAPRLSHASPADMVADFRRRVEDVRALVYVREPISYMRSVLQQGIKRNGKLRMDPAYYYPRFRTRLAPWEEALGRDAISYAIFDRANFAGGDLLTDFANRIGARAVPERVEANPSLSAEAFALFYALRKFRETEGPTDVSDADMRRALADLMRVKGRDFEFAPDGCREVIAAHAADLAWMEDRVGRPLPAYRPPEDAIVFNTEADVLAYAEHLGFDPHALLCRAASRRRAPAQSLRRKLARLWTGTRQAPE